MTTNPSLLIDLAGVARLAGVQRPVASMWRTRIARAADPFPSAVDEQGGRMLFDASQVAEWLSRTERGNNPDAQADAAAAAAPPGFSFSDRRAVEELEALITLYSQRGTLEDLSPADLRMVAAETDPNDEFVRAELEAHARRRAEWLDYAEQLIDATYSPSAALALVGRRHATSVSMAGSTGRLRDDAIELVAAATRALVMNAAAESGDDVAVMLDAHDVELTATLAEALGDDVDVSLPPGSDARRARRRLITGGRWLVDTAAIEASRAVVVARVPAGRGDDVATMLRAVDEVSLSMRDTDSAIVIGPARALVDALSPEAELVRSDILRTGRVRGIARLAPGLIEAAPRESLAVWVLGAPMGQVKIADRFTVVADLIDAPLTTATRADLVIDLVASMGSAREVRGHTFRFGRFVRTPNMLARGGSLTDSVAITGRSRASTADLPVLIDAAADAVRTDLEPIVVVPTSASSREPQSIADLIRDGHLRVVSGTRVDPELHGPEGLVVVAASDLDDPSTVGSVRVDQLVFAEQHPSTGLTRPGDVIFRTGPTAAAWVDVDGSRVVAYPARVLRITAADPGGLVPELIAADIVGQPAGPGAWKRWMLRRVSPQAVAPLRGALADIAARSDALRDRAARLDRYAELLAAGVVAGAVTLESKPRANESIDATAADAASTQ
ncbi:hypothetical protein ACFWN7_05705 [Agromyces sp. NPDC058484]|uniref:hypothetical protein n=1 Tax=Agromyces sp. NPDC058484 TaxID=3346524 RepID=UPI003648F8AA